MALIVETGAIITGAESYVTVAEADTYWDTNRANAVWIALTTAEKEIALRIATRYIDSNYSWLGTIVDQDQFLDWPRYEVIDREGRGYDSDEIPLALKHVVMEVALQHATATLDVTSTTRKTIMEKLGPLEQRFTDYGTTEKMFPWIDKMISHLTKGGVNTTRFLKG